jgi:hypothetical protein
MVSMMDILPGAAPLMVDVRQSGSGPAPDSRCEYWTRASLSYGT